MNHRLRQYLQTLGPGILFASTAIGVSHLVQSTRAGAAYGFMLLWAVLAANILKYPFFEYGSRYASATGTSLIDGYRKMGRWMLWLYFIITISSMFFVTAAVGFVAAAFMDNLFGISASVPGYPLLVPTLLFLLCPMILILGKYKILDGLIKMIGAVLLVSTVLAFILTLYHGPENSMASVQGPDIWSAGSIAFLIALMGWMPTAVDLSAWNSLWTLERIRQTGYKPTLNQTLREFGTGYWISAGLSVCFLTLGAFLIYGSGEAMPDSTVGFANRVVTLYTQTMGSWSYIIIAAAAFSIMFGTAIGVFDGYGRALERTSALLFLKSDDTRSSFYRDHVYGLSIAVVAAGAYLIIYFFLNRMTQLVDIATTISFLIAPLIAIVNFRLVTRSDFPAEARPSNFMQVWSVLGILFLGGFSLIYLYLLAA